MAFNAREQLAHIPVVAHETARLAQAFRSWPQSYWSRPAYCPGWTAADAVAHIATGGDFYAHQAAAPAVCDACLNTDAESLILLTVGRADATEKLQSAALTLTGNAEQGKQLCATLFRAY